MAKKTFNVKAKIILGVLVFFLAVLGIRGVIVSQRSADQKENLLELGQRYLDEINYEQAVVCFEAYIEIDPKNVDAYLGLAEAYMALGNVEKAIAVYEEVIIIEPTIVETYIDLSDAYIELDDYNAVLNVLDRGIEETNSEKLMEYRDEIRKEWDNIAPRICGTVFQSDANLYDVDNVGISGVNVSLTDSWGETTVCITDENGHFDTGRLAVGTYTLHFYMDGYMDYQCEIDLNESRYEFDVFMELEGSVVILNPGRYLIDIPEGYTIGLQAETDVVASEYTMEKRNGETEYLCYKETYHSGESLAWHGGNEKYITFLTIYSGTVRATGTYQFQSYNGLDELDWYSETDIEGVFGIEITEGQTVTIDNQNYNGSIDYCRVKYFVKGSDDLIGYNTNTDYWWKTHWNNLGYSGHVETVNTYELHEGESHYSFLQSCNRLVYTITQGSMFWYTEYINKDMLTIYQYDGQ